MSSSSTVEVLHYIGRGRFLAITKPFQPSFADAVGNAPAPTLIRQTELQMKCCVEHYVMVIYHRDRYSSRVRPPRVTALLHCLIQKKWLPNIFDLRNSTFEVKSF